MRRLNPSLRPGVLPVALFVLVVLARVAAAREPWYSHPELLAETAWLDENLAHPALLVVDSGRESTDYDEGHIPGAVFVDAEATSPEIDGVPLMLAPVGRIVEVLEAAGVDDALTVVIHDEGDGLWASRLLWALQLLGHRDARLLNGGLARWVEEGRELSTQAPDVVSGVLTPRVDLFVLATEDWILDHLDTQGVAILDVRSTAEYTGEDVEASRGGHIPGVVHLEWTRARAEGDAPVFLPPDELRSLFEQAGITPDQEIVTYCQGGVRAAHTYFALKLTGYPRVRMYDGSWVEWGNSSFTPVVEGGLPE